MRAFDPSMVEADYDVDEPLLIEGTRITGADMTHLQGVPFTADGCEIVGADLSVMTLVSTRDTLISGCKLLSAGFHKYVRRVQFDDCQLIECSLRMMTLDSVTFQCSLLKQCDFYGSDLKAIAFPESEVHGVGFDNCTLSNVDLSEATDLMIGDPRTLKGSRLADHQVHLIAHRLAELSGIQVGPEPT